MFHENVKLYENLIIKTSPISNKNLFKIRLSDIIALVSWYIPVRGSNYPLNVSDNSKKYYL